jgi:predicted ATPase
MLGDKRFLRTIKLRNILSFGPDTPELELKSLNVLIGPNGSGKSNLIEVIGLLQSAPRSLFDSVRAGGGINEWLWKGSESTVTAEIGVKTMGPHAGTPLQHLLRFTMVGQRAEVVDEVIENHDSTGVYYKYLGGRPSVTARSGAWLTVTPANFVSDQSIVSQRKDPDQYPEITFLGNEYAKIKLFREWNLGRNTPPRKPQPSDLPAEFLSEDAANLALVLNDLEHRSNIRSNIVEQLRDADDSIVDFSTRVLGGTIQLHLHYSGLKSPVPATRLSDGTIRYLCLLAVLCHPDPPPLVCLEEPELGLHPDLIGRLAGLLIDASHRMQLIVTTHSDVLIDGLTKTPEAVVVCEKQDGSTTMSRRSAEELAVWLKDYGLGQLWRSGEIGGNRW